MENDVGDKETSNIDTGQIIEWRRHFHQYPEVSGKEVKTAEYIAKNLEEMGYKVTRNVAGLNGVLAYMPGKSSKKCVALRADMDALPISEETKNSFKSKNAGSMHACGHDAHMAIALGTAKTVAENPVEGGVKFIFQPREEKAPGGARFMIDAGVLKNPKVDAVLGLHVAPFIEVGKIGTKNGPIMAIADDFRLVVKGKGGHGSAPQNTVDPIVLAAEVITTMQNIASRFISTTEPFVLSFGTINGGTAQNIIPDKVEITGTLRCLSESVRMRAIKHFKKMLKKVTEAFDADYELEYIYGYPSVMNDADLNDLLRATVKEENYEVHEMRNSLMAGEDFSYYGEKTPALFFMLGSGSTEKTYPWHHSCFDIDEQCLPIGVDVMYNMIRKITSEDKRRKGLIKEKIMSK